MGSALNYLIDNIIITNALIIVIAIISANCRADKLLKVGC